MKRPIKLYNADVSVTYDTSYTYNVPSAWEKEFLGSLADAISCEVSEERNGKYELEMVYPATGINAEKLISDRIIEAYVPLRDSIGKNLFRIYRVERDMGGRVYVYARQVSFDLSYYVATNEGIHSIPGGITNFPDSYGVRSYGMNLRAIANADLPFSFGGDAAYDVSVTGVGFQQDWSSCTSIRSYLGGEELTGYDLNALQRFGGEYEFTEWGVNLWETRGSDRPNVITYGTNMEDLMADDDLDGVYTSVCFFAIETDGIEYTKYCSDVFDTSYASLFPYPRVKTVDYSAEVLERFPDGGATAAQITTMLNNAAQAYATGHDAEGNPVRKIEIDAVEAAISGVYLCDTVKIIYRRNGLDVNGRMKITAYTWDVIMQRYTQVTLGAIQTSLAKIIAENGNKADVLALQNVAASTQNAIQELQAKYVLKAGDTMTGSLNVKDTDFPTSAPSSNYTDGDRVEFTDSNDDYIGYVQPIYTAGGYRGLELAAMREVNGTRYWNAEQLLIDGTGAAHVSLNQVAAWRTALFPSTGQLYSTAGTCTRGSLINCTGTAGGAMYAQILFGRFFILTGRLYVTSFVRSGVNPGFNITLPSTIPTPLTTFTESYGYRGENAREQVIFHFTAGSRAVKVTTSESFANAANGTLTLVVPAAVQYLR